MNFNEVKGQEYVKRALEVALVGHFNVALVGPHGSGKTMLATCAKAIGPNIKVYEALPCPCGNFTDTRKACICTPFVVQKHFNKLKKELESCSLIIEVPKVYHASMSNRRNGESSEAIKSRVAEVELSDWTNIELTKDAEEVLKSAILELGFSAKTYDVVLKVARVIADMDASKLVDAVHVAEAVGYRMFDTV